MKGRSDFLDSLPAEQREASIRLFDRLDEAPDKWLSRAEVIKTLGLGSSRGPKLLLAMTRAEVVLDLGNLGRSKVYIGLSDSKARARKLDLTKTALLSQHVPGTFKVMPLSEKSKVYVKSLPSGLRKLIKSAVAELKKDRRVVPIKAGNGKYFVYVDAFAEYLPTAPMNGHVTMATRPSPGDSAERLRTLNIPAIRTAYRNLTARSHLPDVLIHDLHQHSGTDLGALQDWLIRECQAHRAIPAYGEPTAVSDDARQAALQIGGESFLLVRLQETTS